MGTAMEARTYNRRESVVFCKTKEEFGGLSNMAPGFLLYVNDVNILTSEALYQACRFPALPDIQRLIIDQKSPMTAKMKSKPYRSQSRADWDAVRVSVMRWCLRVKLACNWTEFRDLLLATGDRPIVEESRKDDFWGAKVDSGGVLAGANVLGRLLMELRGELRGAASDSLRCVEPLAISDFLLYGNAIRAVDALDASPRVEDLFTARAVNRPATNADDRASTPSVAVPTLAPVEMASCQSTASGEGGESYPKRLIEVDLPIKEISAHARREKSIRHGHISTLHIWWARRPLAACRGVVLAALWPDPADPQCPAPFRDQAATAMRSFRNRRGGAQRDWSDPEQVRAALLAFIAEFANWDNAANRDFLETARHLTKVAHESLGGAKDSRPLVVDPFAGGGAIPLEALRVGADTFASDLNPVAVLLNKVVLEYIPRHGERLAEEVRRWGAWVKERAEAELSRFYPKDDDKAVPIAYLWARTIRCEGPACGAEVPLVRSGWLSKRRGRPLGMLLVSRPDKSGVNVEIVEKLSPHEADQGTVRRGSATCPCCGYTTPVTSVRTQLKARRGGAADARLLCVVTTQPGQPGRFYRAASTRDLEAVRAAGLDLVRREREHEGPLSLVPNEPFSGVEPRRIPIPLYGMSTFGDLFTPRQALAITTLVRLVREAAKRCRQEYDPSLAEAVATCLALVVDRQADKASSLARWDTSRDNIANTFARQALPMVWDFAEANPLSGSGGDWGNALDWVVKVCEANVPTASAPGHALLASATAHPLPNDTAHAVITDPPYYFSVPYADLSDFFYVWLRRSLAGVHPALFGTDTVPKNEECIQNLPHSEVARLQKSRQFYEDAMAKSLTEARRVARPDAIATIVFAHSETEAWEAFVSALVRSGWIVTASWPIDTEMAARVIAQRQSVLASSVHLVCRPRENPDGSLRTDVGDWRAVLRELPRRIHEWMPRLAQEGVVGADAIFACLGPALEVFSRYSRVEKANGEVVTLRDYLEHVWAAVAREALSMIFEDADTAGLEEDARLTAMWLWTLSTNRNDTDGSAESDEANDARDNPKQAAFTLEFDAARKIAQGLGAHLEDLARVVEIKGDTARLLPVLERTQQLFGKEEGRASLARRAKKNRQLTLFEELEAAEEEAGWSNVGLPPAGETVLDRVHQSMVLFAAGRGEALKRFLVAEGIGKEARFWKLAQALSALYPHGTEEKRWVDGVLARKKGLGF